METHILKCSESLVCVLSLSATDSSHNVLDHKNPKPFYHPVRQNKEDLKTFLLILTVCNLSLCFCKCKKDQHSITSSYLLNCEYYVLILKEKEKEDGAKRREYSRNSRICASLLNTHKMQSASLPAHFMLLCRYTVTLLLAAFVF